MQIQPLIEGQFFYIHNRGVNGENLFKEKKNYYHFLNQYRLYCPEVLETYAYCLLKNHFHLVANVKENVEVTRKDGQGLLRLPASKQLSHFFNSCAQSINKMYDRTGPLFESPFERKLIDDPGYLNSVICYCHQDPQLHGLKKDFRDWEFSSYHAIVNDDNDFISPYEVTELFGGIERFKESHDLGLRKNDFEKYGIECKKEEIYHLSPSPARLVAAGGINRQR